MENGGKLVIADIIARKNCGIIGNCASYIAMDFINAPSCNNEDVTQWVQQLQDTGFTVNYELITDDTFVPYFDHIINEFDHNDIIIRWGYYLIVSLWRMICKQYLPFDYVVAVCTKN